MKRVAYLLGLFGLFFSFRATLNKVESREPEKEIDKILIIKSERKLYLLSEGKRVKEYDIDLGFAPKGHKEQEGDGKTPEGIYKISGRNPKSKYFLSLRVSYPKESDKKKARSSGASPGGDIMIHGLPNGMGDRFLKKLLKKDWTLGCIALKGNEEMQEIWDMVKNGTEIEIRK